MKKAAVRLVSLFILISFLFYPVFSAPKDEKKVNLKGFDEYVTKLVAEWKVPGMAVSIVKDGKVIYAQGFGFRNVKQGLKVTPHTLFAIGSCSKAFTAADMGILVDEGKVDLDKPVRTYLPTFKLFDIVATEHMTPRDLLCHRSGLPRHDLMWFGSPYTRQEIFDRLQYLEPNKEFRSVWQYQNLMFMTAGLLVGQAAGMSWEDFTRTRIMEPLGMKESNFSVTASQKTPDFALPYAEIKDKVEEIPFRNIDAIGPAGSINSNVLDMANWVLLNLGKGKFGDKQIVSEASMAQIHMPQMAMQQPIRYDEVLYPSYGMGWGIAAYRGHLLLEHGGGIDGFIAMVSFMPRDNFGVVILTNMNETSVPSIVLYNICDRLLGLTEVPWNTRIREQMNKAKAEAEKQKKEEDKDRKLNTKPSHPLEDYAGDYENPAYGTFSIIKAGDALKAKYNFLEAPLAHYHYDIFQMAAELYGTEMKQKISFTTDLKGNIASLSVQLEPAVKDIVFSRAAEKAMMEKSFLEKFVGEYELSGAIVKVLLKGEKTLVLAPSGQPEYELIPYKGTEFNLKGMSGYSAEFRLDPSGAVTEIVFHQPNGTFTAKKK